MSCECVDIIRGTPWLDTVDQEHIPLEVMNNCGSDIKLNISILAEKEILYSAKIKISNQGKHKIEIVTDKYYEALDINVSLLEGDREICEKFIKLMLR